MKNTENIVEEPDDANELTEEMYTQFGLALNHFERNYDQEVSVGRHLDGKLTTLFAGGSLFISLSTAAGITFKEINDYSGWQMLLMLPALCAFVAMVVVTIRAWAPSAYDVPGKTSKGWKHLVFVYLDCDLIDSYKQVLSNTVNAAETVRKRNERKAECIQVSAILLVVQVVAVVVVALTL